MADYRICMESDAVNVPGHLRRLQGRSKIHMWGLRRAEFLFPLGSGGQMQYVRTCQGEMTFNLNSCKFELYGGLGPCQDFITQIDWNYIMLAVTDWLHAMDL